MNDLIVAGLAYFEVFVPPYAEPAPGEEVFVEGIRLALGGALNTASVAGALGLDVLLCVAAGRGMADQAVELVAGRLGIALQRIGSRDNPAVSLVFADAADRSFVSAADFAALAAVTSLPRARWVHVPGLEEASRLAGALAAARSAGARVSVSGSWSTARLAELEQVQGRPWDLLVLNEKEAAAACGAAAAAPLRLAGAARSVVVTAGAAGAYGVLEGQAVRTTAEQGPVVDPTGAGDAFCAGLLAALIGGAGADAAMRHASRAAARILGQPGGLAFDPESFADLAREGVWKS